MADLYTQAFADNIRMFKSKEQVFTSMTAAVTYNIVRIPRFAFLLYIGLNVSTAFDATAPTCTLGYDYNGTQDVDAFLTDTQAALGTAGVKVPINGTNAVPNGMYFGAASGAITITLDLDEDGTEGALNVFGAYVVIV